jgi:hypothetical protein
MKDHVIRRLASIDQEIAAVETELGVLHDAHALHGSALTDSELRMLVAETPVADQELHRATAAFLASERSIGRLEEILGELRQERAGLERRRAHSTAGGT